MTKRSLAVELDDETLRSLSVFGTPVEVLVRLAHLAAGSERRPQSSTLEALFDSVPPPRSMRLQEDVTLIADQREANEQMVRSTIRAQDRAAAADEGKVRAEGREHALRAVAELREMFIGILGHDLRNPLNSVITSAATLLRRGRLDDHDVETTVRIIRSGQRITRMITQLLDLTRARLGSGLAIEPHESHMGDLCRNVVDEFEAPIRLEARGDLNGTWDPDRLAEVISNLTGNALEYAAPGTLVAVEAHDEGDFVVVEVSNLGDPIPPDVLPFIFQPFRRARQREKSMAGNLGLGLYIAHQIVLSHGGTLEASSLAGTTKFVMRLPRIAAVPTALAQAVGDSDAPPVLVDIDTISRQAVLDIEARSREGEERYRRLFESIDEGFCVIEKLERAPGALLDFRFLEANPAFSSHSGMTGVVGKTIRQLIHDEADDWLPTYDAVCQTGEPIRFERDLASTQRVLEVHAFRVEDGTSRRVAVLFTDITARKRLERELEERTSDLAGLDPRLSIRPPLEPDRPRRILVVDDEAEMAEMLGYLLEAEGHETLVTHDGWSTLEAARTFLPDVVVLDLGLPGMDGYEVARKLRDEHGDSRFLLIAVTGYQNDARRLREAGFDGHLTKPPDMQKLFALIEGSDGRAAAAAASGAAGGTAAATHAKARDRSSTAPDRR